MDCEDYNRLKKKRAGWTVRTIIGPTLKKGRTRLEDKDLKSEAYCEDRTRREKRAGLVQEMGEEEGTIAYKRWKQERDHANKMAGIKRKSGMQPLREWTRNKTKTYPKKRARNKVLRKTLRRSPMVSEAARHRRARAFARARMRARGFSRRWCAQVRASAQR